MQVSINKFIILFINLLACDQISGFMFISFGLLFSSQILNVFFKLYMSK